jgi:class 3 adenylate cyclase/tetratricopeptide (TPR) repeat protein
LCVIVCPTCGQENPEGFRFCGACAAPLQGATPTRQERKVVTALFCDLVGSTTQGERLDPEDLQAVLSRYHEHVSSELERFGGIVEKFIGDAVVALFGAPVAHEDDPERAVRAALAVRDWVSQQPDLQVRMAVNTGEALVVLGARAAQGEHLASGDVLNTAARMQSAAPVDGILVGEKTFRATERAIEYREHEPVRAKGKAEPVRAWEVVHARSRPGVDVEQTPRAQLIGRERELSLVREAFERAHEEREPQLFTVMGVPGIGKSRLVYELSRIVDAESELITWRQGRCLPYGEGVTFWALGEMLKAEAGILESDTPSTAAQKLRAAVDSVIDDAGEARWVESELETLLGLAVAGSKTGGGETTTAAWRRFIEALAERRPTVLVFEDLHWADEGLLEFLDDLIDWLTGVPLLVVATARPELLERRPTWGGGKANAATISLQPLDDSETGRLIAALFGRSVQLADERRLLLERAGGNPLFAEQYVHMLAERGTSGELPESVHGVIAARIDALPAEEKQLLQEASVLGKVFWLGAVANASGMSVSEAERLLRALARKDFIRRERSSTVVGDTQYVFHHVLLRDVAYGLLPRGARAEKHRRAAEWSEGLGRPDDRAELLAHHYKQALELARAAGNPEDPRLVERALESFRAAGERALALSAYAAADDFFVDALALCAPEHPARPRLLVLRARALFNLSGARLELVTEAIEGFDAAGDCEGKAEAAAEAGRFAWFAGDRAATDRYMTEALEAVADRPASPARAVALAAQSGFLMLEGRYEESIGIGAEALPLVEELGMDEQRARLHIVVGTARCCLGDPGGLDEIESGIAIADAAGSAEMVVNGYMNLSSELYFFGRLGEAEQAWRRAVEWTKRYFQRTRSSRADGIGWAYLDGRWDEALAGADELVEEMDAGRRSFTDAMVLCLRGWIRFARGDEGAADRDTARAVELARGSDLQAQSQAYPARAAISLALGRRDDANQLASELAAMGPAMIAALCTPSTNLAEVAWIFRDLGRERDFIDAVLDPDPILGPWHEAARAIVGGDLVRAAEVIESIGHPASAAYARLRAAEVLAAAGQHSQAASQYMLAEAFYRSVRAIAFLRDREFPAGAPALPS